MASIKITASKGGTSQLENYLKQESKTQEVLMSGVSCNIENFSRDFAITRNINNQNSGRQHYHIVQSFAKGEGTPEQVHEIGRKLANSEEFKGFQVAVVTHTDKGHLHNHIVVNAVSYETGKKYVSNAKSLYQIRDISDNLCKEQELSVIQEKTKGKTRTYSMAKHKAFENHDIGKEKSYVLETTQDVVTVTKEAISKEDFIQKMNEKGYEVKWSDELKENGDFKYKNITFSKPYTNAKGEEKLGKVRLSNIQKTFNVEKLTREGLQEKFQENLRQEKEQIKQEPVKEPIRATETISEPKPSETTKEQPKDDTNPFRASDEAFKERLRLLELERYKTKEKELKSKINGLEKDFEKYTNKARDISKAEDDRTILKREMGELNYRVNTNAGYISELENKASLIKMFSKKQDKKEIEIYQRNIDNAKEKLSEKGKLLLEAEKTIAEKNDNDILRDKVYKEKGNLELELKEVRAEIMKNRADIQFIELKNGNENKVYIAVKDNEIISSKEPNIFELKPIQQVKHKSLEEGLAMYKNKGFKPVKELDKELEMKVEELAKTKKREMSFTMEI